MIKLIANYSKRLGLPGYSSHQFAVTVETEISNISEVAAENTRLYQTLQQSVDDEIQHTGFVPAEGYGISEQGGRNGHHNGHSAPFQVADHGVLLARNGHTNGNGDAWNCSEKQQDLIIKLVTEHQLDKGQLDDTSHQMFGVGVRGLNKLQASGLIDRIIADNGGRKTSRPPRNNGAPKRAYANGGAR